MSIESMVVVNDFPEGIKEFVEIIGVDLAMEIIDYCGGSMMYFPSKSSVHKNARNRIIKSKFNGANFREISRTYGISEVQVRNILKN